MSGPMVGPYSSFAHLARAIYAAYTSRKFPCVFVNVLFPGPGADMSAVKASGLVAGAAGVAGN